MINRKLLIVCYVISVSGFGYGAWTYFRLGYEAGDAALEWLIFSIPLIVYLAAIKAAGLKK